MEINPTAGDRQERWLTVPALARETKPSISAKRIRKAIRDGRLPAYTFGGTWPRVSWSDFVAWVRSTRVRPTVPAAGHAEARAVEILEREQSRTGGERECNV